MGKIERKLFKRVGPGKIQPHFTEMVMMEWQPLNAHYVPDGCKASFTDIALPLYPEEPARKETFNFRVSRLIRGSEKAKVHLVLLAGGPGQKGSIYLKNAKQMMNFLPSDVAVYMPIHRGLGRSGKIQPAASEAPGKATIKVPPVPLDSLTVQNASWDIITLASLIQSGLEDAKSHQFVLYGASYGGFWATRIINLAPDLFDSALLNSPLVARHFWDNGNDRDILASCSEDSFCNAQMNRNPDGIRNSLSYVLRPNFNECTQKFHSFTENYTKMMLPFASNASNVDLPVLNLGLLCHLSRLNGVYSTISFIALLNKMYKCPNPEDLNEFTDAIKVAFRISTSVNLDGLKKARDRTLFMDIFGNGSSINENMNLFLAGSEMLEVWKDDALEYCTANTINSMNNLGYCLGYFAYRDHWKKHFANFQIKPSPLHSSPIKTAKTRVYIFHGAMDPTTPLPAVEQFLKDSQAPVKRLIVQKNMGHGVFFGSRCASKIFSEVLGQSWSLSTNFCMMWENRAGADWAFNEFSDVPELAGILWNSNPSKLRSLPNTRHKDSAKIPPSALSAESNWAREQSLHWALFISFLLGIILVLLGLALIVLLLVRRRNASQKLKHVDVEVPTKATEESKETDAEELK